MGCRVSSRTTCSTHASPPPHRCRYRSTAQNSKTACSSGLLFDLRGSWYVADEAESGSLSRLSRHWKSSVRCYLTNFVRCPIPVPRGPQIWNQSGSAILNDKGTSHCPYQRPVDICRVQVQVQIVRQGVSHVKPKTLGRHRRRSECSTWLEAWGVAVGDGRPVSGAELHIWYGGDTSSSPME